MNLIGVVAAMPQEIAPLLRRVGTCRKEPAGGFNLYRFELAGVSVALIESGMGPRHAREATVLLVERVAPKLLLNYGFAGGVLSGTDVGDLVLAQRVLFLEEGRLTQMPQPDASLGRAVAGALAGGPAPVREGSFVTAAVITNKKSVAALLPPGTVHPVLEMETAAVAKVAAEAGIPFVALRGISDAADEELGFSLEEFCDAELNIRMARVLGTVARKPWIIPQLIRLSGNTGKAGKILAQGVEAALRGLAGDWQADSGMGDSEHD